jgi:hypothetical protein
MNVSILSNYMISYVSWKELSDITFKIEIQYNNLM